MVEGREDGGKWEVMAGTALRGLARREGMSWLDTTYLIKRDGYSSSSTVLFHSSSNTNANDIAQLC